MRNRRWLVVLIVVPTLTTANDCFVETGRAFVFNSDAITAGAAIQCDNSHKLTYADSVLKGFCRVASMCLRISIACSAWVFASSSALWYVPVLGMGISGYSLEIVLSHITL